MQNETLKMIPTSYRTKIPHALSYAAGAQMLSLAWQDVPQFDDFALLLLCDVPRELSKNSVARSVLSINYSDWHPTRVSRFWEKREDSRWMWNVRVGVCRSADAHEIREWLNTTGLVQAREWLHKVAHLDDGYTSVSWGASFDEDLREFHVTHSE